MTRAGARAGASRCELDELYEDESDLLQPAASLQMTKTTKTTGTPPANNPPDPEEGGGGGLYLALAAASLWISAFIWRLFSAFC